MPLGSHKPEPIKLRPYSPIDNRPDPNRAFAGQEGRKAQARLPQVRQSRRARLARRFFNG